MTDKPSLPPEAQAARCAAAQRFRCDDVEFDVGDQSAWRNGQPLLLTACEWTLLAALARRGGNALPRSVLLDMLARAGVARSGNALNIHLCNLRRKVGKDVIQTIRGRGYRLVAPRAIDVATRTCGAASSGHACATRQSAPPAQR